MGPFVLDTDHVTLLQRGNRNVVERFVQIPEEEVATAIITYEEQLAGNAGVLRRGQGADAFVSESNCGWTHEIESAETASVSNSSRSRSVTSGQSSWSQTSVPGSGELR